ncbi:hypothetical protein Pint_25974 [Pistacia integerrima]|uniref:Uncharacterized protein n=2 Tax=Pistacia TaxID=55512 RepID=A0ACC1B2U6_9ROSI|nr:hypothetical protein Pint_25974 [Pistacia integerrima]KAJ0093270.1 hypothetical protein Patl1_26595 [Pistacia atlantica]
MTQVPKLLSQYISSKFHSRLEIQIALPEAIFWLCDAFVLALILLDHGYYKVRNTVSSTGFVVFVMSIMLSFTGAFSALLIRNKPKLARRCYFLLSIVSMASALSVLGYALFLESFRWVYLGLNSGKMNISVFQI